MFRIAICDDEPLELEGAADTVRRHLGSQGAHADVAVFRNASALIGEVEHRGGFDVYLLDIIMPAIDGIACAQRLRQLGATGQIIFLTTSSDYAVQGYDVRAYHYLIKPVTPERLCAVLDGALADLPAASHAAIVVASPTGSHRILLHDVLYAERAGRRVRYHGSAWTVESLSIRVPFREAVSSLLGDVRFCAAGASYAVNMARVEGVMGRDIRFDTGDTLQLPRDVAASFKAAWGEFWLSGGAR